MYKYTECPRKKSTISHEHVDQMEITLVFINLFFYHYCQDKTKQI